MFQYAETDPTLADDVAAPQETELRIALLQQQYRRLKEGRQTLLVVLAGIDGAGKGSTINLLNTWLDPRHVHTLAYDGPTAQDAMRPSLWRYWRDLPGHGQTGVVFGSWYYALLKEAAGKNPDSGSIAAYARLVNRFEAMLAAEQVQVLKLWFHLSRDAQQTRAENMLRDPETAWRVSKADLRVHKLFKRLRNAGELVITQTHRQHAPWIIIPSADPNMRTHCTAKAILAAMEQGLASNVHADAPLPALLLPVSPDEGMNDTGIGNEEKAVGARAVVGRAAATHKAKATIKAKAHNGARRGGKGSGKNESRDAGKNDNTTTKASTSEDGNGERGTNGKNNDYDKRLAALQASIARATRRKAFAHHSMVLVFEGQDAAGKGGTIRRVTAALDVRDYDVHPISAPTDEERARPYLWRFWRHLPAVGKAAIFDRSWYGRVLVERVEKFATAHAIDRAYDEINDFELQLAESGALVLKFWLDVSKDVQLQRFHEREKSPFKSFKITPDDWRNRAKWNAYQNARRDMLVRTCTEHAPWHVIQSDDKKAARLQVLAVIAEALQGLR